MLKRRPLNKQQPNSNQNQNKPAQQKNKKHNQQGNSQNRHHNKKQRHRPPPPPPAYMQRDLLLIANTTASKKIEEVRQRFDPMIKKLPAHITLLLPEPAAKISNDFLKKMDLTTLPKLKSLTFQSIEIYDDIYLWLIPDSESSEKIQQWHQELIKNIPEHTQGEKYIPHLTLGYIPRKVPEDEALSFAKSIISTPLTLEFDQILLEEFSEDQNSKSVDRLQVVL